MNAPSLAPDLRTGKCSASAGSGFAPSCPANVQVRLTVLAAFREGCPTGYGSCVAIRALLLSGRIARGDSGPGGFSFSRAPPGRRRLRLREEPYSSASHSGTVETTDLFLERRSTDFRSIRPPGTRVRPYPGNAPL